MDVVLVRFWIVVAYFVNFSLQFHGENDCRMCCIAEDGKKCSETVPCHINYDNDYWVKYISDHVPAKPSDFDVEPQCRGNPPYVGFLVSWTFGGRDMKENKRIRFEISKSFRANPGGKAGIQLTIDTPKNIPLDKYVHFEYFFHGVEDQFNLSKNSYYIIRVSIQSNYTVEKMTEVVKKGRNPILQDNLKGCQNVSTDAPGTITPRSTVHLGNTEIGLLISAAALLTLIIVFTIVCITFKKRQDMPKKKKNLLLLLNAEISQPASEDDLRTLVTTIGTRAKSKNYVQDVRCNFWETLTTDSLLKWVQDQKEWADVIVITSVPDKIEKTLHFHSYNNAFVTALESFVLGKKDVFVFHTESLENHKHCPFVNSKLYKTVRIGGDDWEKHLRRITKVTECPSLEVTTDDADTESQSLEVKSNGADLKTPLLDSQTASLTSSHV